MSVADFEIDEIEPGLWLGPCPSSPEAVAALSARGIGQILTVQTDDDLERMGLSWSLMWGFLMRSGISPVRVPIVDFNDMSLRRNLLEAVRSLHLMRRNGRAAFVHCSVGINRSPTVVIAYLIACRGMSRDAAWDLVRSRRPIVHPNAAALDGWISDGGPQRIRL